MIKDDTNASNPTGLSQSSDVDTIYKIGDLAREFGVTLRTLRFYEDRKLIVPNRAGTTRIYSVADRENLRLALFGKRIGLSLKEIGAVLQLNEHFEQNKSSIADVYSNQLTKLYSQREQLNEAIEDLSEQIKQLNSAD